MGQIIKSPASVASVYLSICETATVAIVTRFWWNFAP